MFQVPPDTFTLKNNEIHLWLSSLNRPIAEKNSLLELLSDDEIVRSQSILSQQAQSHFVIARGILRTLLGKYLNHAPASITFSYEPHGKPTVTPSNLQFNLSHSGDYALYGFCLNAPIGADIESKERSLEFEAIAKRYFSKEEYEMIKNLPEEKKQSGFLTIWTKKEAFLKATGTGLMESLSSFSVSLDLPSVRIEDPIQNKKSWQALSIDGLPDYHMAIATPLKTNRIKKWIY